MYAIVEIAGQQFKAEAGRRLYVHRLEAEQGSVVEFERVLLIDTDGQVKVGAPTVEGAKVICEVLSHLKGEKVIIFKKKRRKGYKKKNGHRQYFTELKINEVVVA
jgi:large subunit ribosomal protein L21